MTAIPCTFTGPKPLPAPAKRRSLRRTLAAILPTITTPRRAYLRQADAYAALAERQTSPALAEAYRRAAASLREIAD